MTFDQFFQRALGETAGFTPHPYQRTLAGGDEGTACDCLLIDIPTGMGKTAAVVLSWLWNRVEKRRPDWSRRLIFCLPMRSLVEPTRDSVRLWLANLDQPEWNGVGDHTGKVGLHVLMGGEDTGDWDLFPECDAIIIGTQDLLLSRALNRGYASPRARWPMEFGLLNQDCLWALDEVQLMDVGLATTAQLQAFRQDDWLAQKELRPCVSWWMSATLQPGCLESVDTLPMMTLLKDRILRIAPEARHGGPWDLSKPCTLLPIKDSKTWAARAWATHQQSVGGEHGRITIIIANTVRTAWELYAALEILRKKEKGGTTELHLIHSRFRVLERRGWRNTFLQRSACTQGADRIIIATQVIEAGVDISATTLFTELAPWASLVQRFGRAARYGGTAEIFVVDRTLSEKAALPYSLNELEASREALALLPDASLSGLSQFEAAHGEMLPSLFPYSPPHLLLRRELEELVDTTSDLSGADLDISRFIRSGQERDVFVFWRAIEPKTLPNRTIKPNRAELCSVSVGDAREWVTKGGAKSSAWIWDYLEETWRTCRKEDVYSEQTILVAQAAGGYDPTKGWTGKASHQAFPVEWTTLPPGDRRSADATVESEATSQRNWETIASHGKHVASLLGEMVASISLSASISSILLTAARWHDYGKGHAAFQGCIHASAEHHPGSHDIAKAPAHAWRPKRHLYQMPNMERRRGFRHEFATTLGLFAILERHHPQHPALLGNHGKLLTALGHPIPMPTSATPPTLPEQDILDLDQPSFDLLAYLDCAHHGKVRGAWHSSPYDQDYRDMDGRGIPIHGVREGDSIPALSVTGSDGNAHLIPALSIHLEPARMGLSLRTGASWTERVTGLLAAHGPFALPYMESLLRAADIRAVRTSALETVTTGESAALAGTKNR